jgi:hypothetical protein
MAVMVRGIIVADDNSSFNTAADSTGTSPELMPPLLF